MSKQTVEAFIEVTHEEYYKRFGGNFPGYTNGGPAELRGYAETVEPGADTTPEAEPPYVEPGEEWDVVERGVNALTLDI